MLFHTFYSFLAVWAVVFGVFLSDTTKYKNAMIYTKITGYSLWLFHFLHFFFTQLRKYLLVKNEDCTLLHRTSFDNPLYKKNVNKSLDFKYSLCQICLEKGRPYIEKSIMYACGHLYSCDDCWFSNKNKEYIKKCMYCKTVNFFSKANWRMVNMCIRFRSSILLLPKLSDLNTWIK